MGFLSTTEGTLGLELVGIQAKGSLDKLKRCHKMELRLKDFLFRREAPLWLSFDWLSLGYSTFSFWSSKMLRFGVLSAAEVNHPSGRS